MVSDCSVSMLQNAKISRQSIWTVLENGQSRWRNDMRGKKCNSIEISSALKTLLFFFCHQMIKNFHLKCYTKIPYEEFLKQKIE